MSHSHPTNPVILLAGNLTRTASAVPVGLVGRVSWGGVLFVVLHVETRSSILKTGLIFRKWYILGIWE